MYICREGFRGCGKNHVPNPLSPVPCGIVVGDFYCKHRVNFQGTQRVIDFFPPSAVESWWATCDFCPPPVES